MTLTADGRSPLVTSMAAVVLKPFDATGRRFFRGNEQDRRQAGAGAPAESEVSFPQRREYVA